MDTSTWWSCDLFSAMRSTLGADRSREHLDAHARQGTVTHHHLRAEHVVDWATPIKNDDSPAMLPVLHPYGHVAFQAHRGDVHTVLVNGRVVKDAHRLVGIDLGAPRGGGDVPETKVLENPYQYTEYKGRERA
jgi:5-methylthioadenosine/S-adenosylhomocysteine deaminase